MTVEGEDAFCVDINTNFRNGYKTRADTSTRMSYDQISDVALSIEYVNQYVQSHSGLSSQHIYLLKQCVVWQRLSVHLGWQCDNVRASYDEIPKAIQDEVYAGAKAFASENKGRYECGGYIYSGEGQDIGQFWVKLAVGNATLKKTSRNDSITDGNWICVRLHLARRGKGCRQFESYLLAQGRSWYDFLMDALIEGGVMKRLDLAINDRAGILDIPDLTAKCNREECVSLFRSFKSYASGELVKHNEQDKAGMGQTLYIGSLKSEVYFCCYEKNYEQYAKLGVPIEEAPIKNRFEIRLKDERAYYAVRELLTHYDAEQTEFSIINHYIRFVDREPEKRWVWFIGKERPPIKLTTDPEPYTLEKTLGWISRQVAPTLKMLKKIDAGNSTSYLKEIEDNAKLTEKHLQIIRQQTADTEELITE